MSIDFEQFRIEWGTGSMEVSIPNYFSNSTKAHIAKLMRQVKKYCTAEQIRGLRSYFLSEKARLDKVLEPITKLRKQSEKLLSDFYGEEVKLAPSVAESGIIRLRDRYVYGAEMLEGIGV